MVAIETHTYTAPWGWDEGKGIATDNTTYTDFVHNSVHVFGDSSWSAGLYIRQPNNWNNNAVGNNYYNNNIVNSAGGLAVMAEFTSWLDGVDSMDYNNYYSSGSVLADHNVPRVTLQEWQISFSLRFPFNGCGPWIQDR